MMPTKPTGTQRSLRVTVTQGSRARRAKPSENMGGSRNDRARQGSPAREPWSDQLAERQRRRRPLQWSSHRNFSWHPTEPHLMCARGLRCGLQR